MTKKSVRVEFVMSEQEAELVKGRMAELDITNLSAYLRKMAVDGYIIHLDMSDIQEMIRLLRICSNNLNQYARRANETGSNLRCRHGRSAHPPGQFVGWHG